MILGLLRVIYFFGPVLCLALVLLPAKHRFAWPLWGFSALLVAAHALAYFTAKEDGSAETELSTLAVWAPLLLTTIIAAQTRGIWSSWFSSKALAQTVITAVCLVPSVILFLLLI